MLYVCQRRSHGGHIVRRLIFILCFFSSQVFATQFPGYWVCGSTLQPDCSSCAAEETVRVAVDFPGGVVCADPRLNYKNADGKVVAWPTPGRACPAGSTQVEGTYDAGLMCEDGCPSGQHKNASGTCVGGCPQSGTSFSSGWYDMGTSQDGMSATGCTSDGCTVSFSGSSPAGTALVGGVTHYYAQGGYDYLGGDKGQCTPGGLPTTIGAKPADSCPSGQTVVVVDGATKCIDPGTGSGSGSGSGTGSGSGSGSGSSSGSGSGTGTGTGTGDSGTGTGTDSGTGAGTGTGTGSSFPTDYQRDATGAKTNELLQKQIDSRKKELDDSSSAYDDFKAKLAEAGKRIPDPEESWTVDKLGLPDTDKFEKPEFDGLGSALPGSNGSCVQAQIAFFGSTVALDPCPLVSLMSPVMDWAALMFGVISTVFLILGRRGGAEA